MSATIDGTAVAMIVESTAIRPVASITAPRIGPRSERRPTPLLDRPVAGLLDVASPVTSLPHYADGSTGGQDLPSGGHSVVPKVSM
jgi:hypothetical protein